MYQFNCPECKAVLNPGNEVVLIATKKDGHKGIIMLSSQIGDYSLSHHQNFQITKGEAVTLQCPACHVELSKYSENKVLAGIELIDENNQKSAILISSVAGEHCTYKIVNGEITAYGKDSHKYHFDFESLSLWS